jgi:hypothetical protein
MPSSRSVGAIGNGRFAEMEQRPRRDVDLNRDGTRRSSGFDRLQYIRCGEVAVSNRDPDGSGIIAVGIEGRGDLVDIGAGSAQQTCRPRGQRFPHRLKGGSRGDRAAQRTRRFGDADGRLVGKSIDDRLDLLLAEERPESVQKATILRVGDRRPRHQDKHSRRNRAANPAPGTDPARLEDRDFQLHTPIHVAGTRQQPTTFPSLGDYP